MLDVWTILVNYHGAKDTIECIKSLRESTIVTTILIVDNSCDQREIDKISFEYPNVIILSKNKNLGFAEANNIGADYAIKHGATHVLLLNNDTVIDKNMISALLNQSDNKSICVPKMYFYYKPNKIWYGGGEIKKTTGNITVFHYNQEDPGNENNICCSFATGCCMLIPKDLIKKVKYIFRSDYFMYCEDTEFSLRLIENGFQIRYVPSARLWHKVSVSTGGKGSFNSIYYSSRNRIYYIKEHKKYFYPTAILAAYLTRMIRIIQCRIRGNDLWKAYHKALLDSKHNIRGKLRESL